MTFAIVLGSYRLREFIQLNLRQCRLLFGDDVPILVSDDLSPESPQIKAMCEDEGVSYVCPHARRSHFTGDWQAIVNASHFAQAQHIDVALKLSQRLIPLHRGFVDLLEKHFSDPKVGVVVPGRPEKNQFARPESNFYAGFGHLSDLVAFRPEAMPARELIRHYREEGSGPGKKRSDRLVEVCLGRLFAAINGQWRIVLEDGFANHRMGVPKLYLRKSQSNRHEYAKLGEKHGIEGDFCLNEWSQIERQSYLSCGPVV